jgi:membrane protease YdiL (CAAX protease family)
MIVSQILLVEGLLLSEFGITKKSFIRNAILGCVIALIDISFMTLINVFLPVALQGSEVLANIAFEDFGFALTFPWQFIAVGISEELFFRGYFYKKIRDSGKSFLYATLLTSFVFLIFHVPWIINPDLSINFDTTRLIFRVVNPFFLGVINCILYEKTKSLVAPIIYHGFNNSVRTFLIINIAQTPTFLLLSELLVLAYATLIAFITPRIIKAFKLAS